MFEQTDRSSRQYEFNQCLSGLDDMVERRSSQGRNSRISTRALSQSRGTPLARRNATSIPTIRSRPLKRFNISIAAFILLIYYCSFASAAAVVLPSAIADPRPQLSKELRSTLAELAESGTIVVDQRPPPAGIDWQFDSFDPELGRRQEFTLSTIKGNSATSTTKGGPSSTSTVASSRVAAATPLASTALPGPFDSTLGANFTVQSCPNFISNFLADQSFQSCLPFSLLLQTSQAFFQAEKSLVRISQVLDATCQANVDNCTRLMSNLAQNLTTNNNCGADYALGNPTVTQAYTGLIAYKPMYLASCQKNPATSSYCFADAITNASSPTDSYVFLIGLNVSLPGGSQPTCNKCLQETMGVFNAAAANSSQPVSSTYVSAAQQINIQCGPNFVNASIPAPVASAAPAMSLSPFTGFFALALCVMAWFL